MTLSESLSKKSDREEVGKQEVGATAESQQSKVSNNHEASS